MLIRFTVEKFLSFNQRIDFNMLASDEERHPHHVVHLDNPQKRQILRTSVLYGANASGKSNLIKAIAFAKELIVHGVDKGKNINLKPFKLAENDFNQPARFEFEFTVAHKTYAYGFIVNKQRVCEEWLFDIGQIEEQSIFERREQNINFDYKHAIFTNISEQEKQRLEFEAKGTRENLLFLTNCLERNIKRFNFIYQWFSEKLIVIFPHSKNQFITTFAQFNEQLFNQMLNFCDFGIKRIHLEKINFEQDKDIPQNIKEQIKADFPYGEDKAQFISLTDFNYILQEEHETLQASKIFMVRENRKHQDILFELFEESDGTRRIIDLIPMLMSLYQNDADVVIIDELERSLHTLLSKKLFELILNHENFNNNSQLIATTHEVNLLDIQSLFRKDEIWFVEKDEFQQTTIYSLAGADIDKLNLTNGYLNGRFGAIPFIGNIDSLGWRK